MEHISNNLVEILEEKVTRGLENLNQFLKYYPFRKNPEQIEALTEIDLYNPGYVNNEAYFFYWVEYKTQELGKYSIGTANPYKNACSQLSDFKLLLKRIINDDLTIHEKLDDKWDKISGFGTDRHIAKKILYLYYSNEIIPIWKTEDLILFCSNLDLIKPDTELKSKDVGEQFEIFNKSLHDFKQEIMPDKNNVYFSSLLYGFFEDYVSYYKSGKNKEFSNNIKQEIIRRENTFNIIQYILSKNGVIRNYEDLEALWKLTISTNRFTQDKKQELVQNLNLNIEQKKEITEFFNYNIGCWGQGKSKFVKYDATDDQKKDFFNGVKDILDLMIIPESKSEDIAGKISFLVDNVYTEQVQSATITPLFHTVRPKEFGIINSTEGKIWNDLLRIISRKERKEFSDRLKDYIEMNSILKKISYKLGISLNELDIFAWNYKELKEQMLGKQLKTSRGIPDEEFGTLITKRDNKLIILNSEGKKVLDFLKKNMKII